MCCISGGDLTLTNVAYEVEYTFAKGGSSDRTEVTAGMAMPGR